MEIEVKEEKENPFLGRKELKLDIKHSGTATPTKQDLAKQLASKYSVPEDLVFIDYIFTKKGIGESFAKVKIYKEKPKTKERKKGEKSEAQASEAK